MNRIAIDTSNQVLGIAIMQKGNIALELSTNIKKDHSSRLMPAIVDAMKMVNMTPSELDKIVVATGPGSYTGTRIGVTTAKTMAWTLNIPITPISSLKVLAYNGIHFDGYICPFFDARRKMVFTSLYKWEDGILTEVKKEANVEMEKWLEELALLDAPILFISPDLSLFISMINEAIPNAVISNQATQLLRPSSLLMLEKNEQVIPSHEVVPNYLRITEAEANWNNQQKDGNYHG